MYRMPPTSALTSGRPGMVTVNNRPPIRALYSKRAIRSELPCASWRRHALYAPDAPPPTTAISRSIFISRGKNPYIPKGNVSRPGGRYKPLMCGGGERKCNKRQNPVLTLARNSQDCTTKQVYPRNPFRKLPSKRVSHCCRG